MGGQRAEDERDGAGVGLDEAGAVRGQRFAGDEAGGAGVGAGVGARTAARAGDDPGAVSEAGSASVPAVKAEDHSAADEADHADAADAIDHADPADLTDAQIVGRRLALARRKAELSIEDIAAATRIRPAMVREIEAGEFVHCGGEVYARGHVRAIARFVGIDPKPLIAAHPPVVPTELPPRPRPRIVARSEGSAGSAGAAGSVSSDDEPAEPAPATADRPTHRPASAAVPTSAARDNAARFAARVPSRVIRPAAGGATSGAAGKRPGSGTGVAATRAAGSGSVRPPQPGRKDDPGRIENQPRAANWTAAMLVALLGLVVFAGVQLLGGDGDKQATTGSSPSPAAAPKPAAVVPPPSPTPPPAPKDVEVRIAAIGADSWLNVTGDDGRVLFDNLLPAGATQSFKGAKQLGVTLGNASAVHMNLNGKDLGAAGGPGQVVHWTLNPSGAVNN